MGHAIVTTILTVYTHLFADNHADAMVALEAMSRPVEQNVVPISWRGEGEERYMSTLGALLGCIRRQCCPPDAAQRPRERRFRSRGMDSPTSSVS